MIRGFYFVCRHNVNLLETVRVTAKYHQIIRKFNSTIIVNSKVNEDLNHKLKNTLLNMSPPAPTNKKKQKFKDPFFFAKNNKGIKYPSSHISLQVLGSGALGVPPSLYVFTGQSSYLFNCGEGSQRLAQENKIKLNTIENIFVTHKSWRNVGGIPGMLLTMQDMHNIPKDVMLHGPPGIHTLYTDTRAFVNFKYININYHFYTDNNGVFGNSDDPLTIKAVPIIPMTEQQVANGENINLEYVILNESVPNEGIRGNKRCTPEGENVAENKKSRCDEFTSKIAVAFICQTDVKLGKLCLSSCVKAGVPAGPLLGELKNGRDITLKNGSIVRAKDVTQPDDPGTVFVVVEAPTVAHMRSLINHPSFTPHQTNEDERKIAQVVIHFTPPNIMKTPEYQTWSSKFPSSTTHIIINEDNCCTGSEAVHRLQRKLNYLNPKIFPALSDQSIANSKASQNDESNSTCLDVEKSTLLPDCASAFKAKTLLTFNLRPNTKLSSSQCITINQQQIDSEITASQCTPYSPPNKSEDNSEIISSNNTEENREIISSNSIEDNLNRTEFPVITVLGTGSCLPSKTRNTSGILVQINENSYLIVDCGEGTWGQLVRLVGKDSAYKILTQLRGVYVSHLHADHHLGFINLMLHRKHALKEMGDQLTPIPFLAPHNVIPFLLSYNNKFEEIEDTFEFVNNLDLFENVANYSHRDLYSKLQVSSIFTCKVDHCTNACGVAITTLNDKKIVYSGDTRPCDALVQLGRGCDVLIHEATFEDGLQHEAKLKMHSTVSEALEVARKMAAKHTILTHFSQRYTKVPLLSLNRANNVSIAYDNMRVEISDLPVLSTLYPQFTEMFAEAMEEIKLKYSRKMMAKNRDQAIKEDMN